MGQQQYKASEGKQEEGTGSPHNLNGLKDRVSANFKAGSGMVQNPGASGTGSKGNPGKPV